MIQQYKLEEFLYCNCLKVGSKGAMSYVLRCPICGDSKRDPNKRRCHVDFYHKYDEWVYTCYNGDCPIPSGNVYSLYMHVTGESFPEAKRFLDDSQYDAVRIKKRLKGESLYDVEEEPVKVLDTSVSNEWYTVHDEPDDRIGKRYLRELKNFIVGRYIPLSYNVMIAHSGEYKGRFIIPVYDDNELVYFQGRRMVESDIYEKYMNPDIKKSEIVFNKGHFDRDKYIVLCEGLIDSMMVSDRQGTSCLGAKVSEEFIQKLLTFTDKGVIIALDNPAIDKAGYKVYRNLVDMKNGQSKLRYFFMPDGHKDMNDFVKSKGMGFLSESYNFVVNQSVTQLQARMTLSKIAPKQ